MILIETVLRGTQSSTYYQNMGHQYISLHLYKGGNALLCKEDKADLWKSTVVLRIYEGYSFDLE